MFICFLYAANGSTGYTCSQPLSVRIIEIVNIRVEVLGSCTGESVLTRRQDESGNDILAYGKRVHDTIKTEKHLCLTLRSTYNGEGQRRSTAARTPPVEAHRPVARSLPLRSILAVQRPRPASRPLPSPNSL